MKRRRDYYGIEWPRRLLISEAVYLPMTDDEFNRWLEKQEREKAMRIKMTKRTDWKGKCAAHAATIKELRSQVAAMTTNIVSAEMGLQTATRQIQGYKEQIETQAQNIRTLSDNRAALNSNLSAVYKYLSATAGDASFLRSIISEEVLQGLDVKGDNKATQRVYGS